MGYNGTNEMTVGRLLIPPAMAPMPDDKQTEGPKGDYGSCGSGLGRDGRNPWWN